MKKTTVLLVFLLMTIMGYSQTDNWYISFSMAGTFPMGSFAQSSPNPVNNTSGFAQKGFSLLLDATYPLTSNWGLKGLVLINTNSMDNNKLENMLLKRVPTLPETPNPNYFSATANPWMSNALLGGPVYTSNFGRAYLDFQILGGVNVTYLPQQKLQYNNPSNQWYYLDQNKNSTDVSWGVLAGSAFRFPVSPRLNLKVGVNYFRSNATIQYQQIQYSELASPVMTQTLGSGSNAIPIQMFTGTIGFVYYLN